MRTDDKLWKRKDEFVSIERRTAPGRSKNIFTQPDLQTMRPPTSEQVFSTVHTEFGHCAEEKYRTTSQHEPGTPLPAHVEQDPPYYILLSTYISYLILICLGHVRDFVGKRLKPVSYRHLMPQNVRLQILFVPSFVPARLCVGISLLQPHFIFFPDAVLTIYPGLCTSELRFRFLLYPKAENKNG